MTFPMPLMPPYIPDIVLETVIIILMTMTLQPLDQAIYTLIQRQWESRCFQPCSQVETEAREARRLPRSHSSFHCTAATLLSQLFNNSIFNRDFPGGGPVDKNLPPNAGDSGSIPGPGRSHLPCSNRACGPQLQSPRALEPRAPEQEKQWQ